MSKYYQIIGNFLCQALNLKGYTIKSGSRYEVDYDNKVLTISDNNFDDPENYTNFTRLLIAEPYFRQWIGECTKEAKKVGYDGEFYMLSQLMLNVQAAQFNYALFRCVYNNSYIFKDDIADSEIERLRVVEDILFNLTQTKKYVLDENPVINFIQTCYVAYTDIRRAWRIREDVHDNVCIKLMSEQGYDVNKWNILNSVGRLWSGIGSTYFPSDIVPVYIDILKNLTDEQKQQLQMRIADQAAIPQRIVRTKAEEDMRTNGWSKQHSLATERIEATVFNKLRQAVNIIKENERTKSKENLLSGRLNKRALYKFMKGNTHLFKKVQESNIDNKNLHVVIAYDTSGSMDGARICTAMGASLGLARAIEGANKQCALFAFSDEARLVKPFSKKLNNTLKEKIMTSTYDSGGTNGMKPLIRAMQYLEQTCQPGDSKVFIHITDGDFYDGETDFMFSKGKKWYYSDYVKEANRRGITIKGISIASGAFAGKIPPEHLAEVKNVNELVPHFVKLFKKMAGRRSTI